jgi:phenol/toluene 2-monooxygenase (NADH) P4/A4
MAVRSIGEYRFPSRSRQELYGDDQLVHVWWRGNLWFVAAACFRAPKAMSWNDFLAGMVHPLFSGDPDFDAAGTAFTWTVDERPISPEGQESLESLGVGHKSLLTCVAG